MWPLIFWVWSKANEGTVELEKLELLLGAVSFKLISSVEPVIFKVGLASMSIVDLEIVRRGFRTDWTRIM